MRPLRSLVLLLVLAGCSAVPEAQVPQDGPPPQTGRPWSVRMADAVMQRRPIVRERWDYETGTVLRGIEELWAESGNDRYFDYIRRNLNEYIQPDGSIRTYPLEDYNLDNINTGKLLFLADAETDDPRYRAAADLLWSQLQDQPTTSEGGYWHKQRYPYQMWLDGLYMAEPFAARYALEWGDEADREEALDHIARQYLLAARYMRDPATGLYYHGWDEAKEQVWADPVSGLSQNFWGRAMGWYAMALVDVLDYFPEDHRDHEALVRLFQQYAEAVVGVQDPVTGVWYQVLDLPTREGNYLESSASAMFTYALLKGVRKGWLPRSTFLAPGVRAYRGLVHEFVRVGDDGLPSVTQVVSVAGLGGDNDRDGTVEYYLSEPVVADDPKVVGPFILASIEFEMLGLPLR